jgi:hypothetical protein
MGKSAKIKTGKSKAKSMAVSSAQSRADTLLAEATKRPGILDLMAVYGRVLDVQRSAALAPPSMTILSSSTSCTSSIY